MNKRFRTRTLWSARLLPILLLLAWAPGTQAAVITVTSQNTPGCTLNDAIRAADADAARGDCSAGSGTDTIRLERFAFSSGIGFGVLLESALPTINSSIVIEPVDESSLAISRSSAVNRFRVLDVNNGNLTLRRINVRGGSLQGALDGGGAGIRVRNGSLTLDRVVINENFMTNTGNGGGGVLASDSTLNIYDSRFVNNSARNDGGNQTRGGALHASFSEVNIQRSSFLANNASRYGIHSFENSQVVIEDSYYQYSTLGIGSALNTHDYFDIRNSTLDFTNTTLDSDAADGAFPALRLANSAVDFLNVTIDRISIDTAPGPNPPMAMVNTIFNGECNFAQTLPPAFNIIQSSTCNGGGDNAPQLLAAADNGGPTLTRALRYTSQAIDAGNNTQCPSTDQRGMQRVDDCDIGAFEYILNADIEVDAQVITPGPYYVGQEIRVNATVRNNSPESAFMSLLSLTPSNLTVASAQGGGCSSSLTCSFVTLLGNGAEWTVSYIVVPDSIPPGNFGLTFAVAPDANANYTELDPSNNSVTVGGTLVSATDVGVIKTLLTPGPYAVGQTVNYRVKVDNNGPNDVIAGLVVTDTPVGLSLTSISNCNNQPAGPCGFTSLAAGASITLDVAAQITAETFDNVAEVSINTFDPDPRNNQDAQFNGGSATFTSDISVSLQRLTPAPIVSGQVADYDVKVSNNGSSAATNVVMNFVSQNFFVVGVIGNCGANLLPCEIGTLASGESSTIRVQGLLQFSALATVEATAQSDATDNMLANNTAADEFTALESADVLISLTPLSPGPYFHGQTIRYRMTVSNFGDDVADNVMIGIDTDNLLITSALGNHCDELPCAIRALNLLENEIIEIVAQSLQPGAFDFRANVFASEIDPNLSNNSDMTNNGGVALAPILPPPIFSDSFESTF